MNEKYVVSLRSRFLTLFLGKNDVFRGEKNISSLTDSFLQRYLSETIFH